MAFQKTVLGSTARDLDSVSEMESVIRRQTGGRVRNLRVECQGTDVILTGTVPTFYVKQLATHAVLDEIGPRTLTNDLCVRN